MSLCCAGIKNTRDKQRPCELHCCNHRYPLQNIQYEIAPLI